MVRIDFNEKLIGGKVAELIEKENGIDLQATPPKRQHQNGLVERSWQTIVAMSQNWLTSSLLPSKYWWFAVKRATEVLNVLPTTHLKNKIITPHELVFNDKVDYRSLFPLFSTAYIKQNCAKGGKHKNKFLINSLKCILVGADAQSDGLLFYHPQSKQLFSADDGCRLDSTLPAGPHFNKTFDRSFQFDTKGTEESLHCPHSFELSSTIYYNIDHKWHAGKITNQPIDEDNEPYVVV